MTSDKQVPYRVLARKYRPQNFDQLIGQDALVRTLKNAIESGRIAHAFMLTGIRGTGKTTTARIIARALNYTGPDGKAGPTTGPTDDCALCQAIGEDRHPDVIEMDAASRTGVDDIREILDGVRYAPSEARYKVYVIDEVHMLSRNAFNALLKTLEEPPPHVKFIFATTEIRKVPVTVLSRCQRFDLRRVEAGVLAAYYKTICEKEAVGIADEALALIARAADGSVRDGLSLLDQAIAMGGAADAEQVRDMLGLSDRAKNTDILEKALTGDMKGALEIMDGLYRSGADPVVLVQDLLEVTHLLTRLRAVPESGAPGMEAGEAERLKALAGELSMPTLGRAWQILLKGLGETQQAPVPQAAAEMVLIRLAYAADLPDPADLLRRLKDQKSSQSDAVSSSLPPGGGVRDTVSASSSRGSARTQAALATAVPQTEGIPGRALRSMEDIVSMLEEGGELVLAGQVYQCAHLVKLAEGRLEIRPAADAPPKLAQDLGRTLSALTGRRWMVSVSGAAGQPTLAARAQARQEQEFAQIRDDSLIAEILEIFPEAKIKAIQTVETTGKD